MFLYYANEESDDVMSQVVPLKQHNTQSGITLEILKQCSLNLAPEMYITKEQNDTHCDSYTTGSVLIDQFQYLKIHTWHRGLGE